MLCQFCQNLVFSPAGELNLPGVEWSELFRYEIDPLAILVSVHQPSQKALEISASRGCRLCALSWFRLFQTTEYTPAHHDNDDGNTQVLIIVKGNSSWNMDEDLDFRDRMFGYLRIYCGERRCWLEMDRPIPGM